MKTRWNFILGAVLAVAFLAVNGCSSTPKIAKNPDDIRQMAKEAYIYGYPLVLMDKTKDVSTGVVSPTTIGSSTKAPVNQVAHFRTFPDDTFTDVVSPNVDTLYSSMWLDLSEEPQVLSIPDASNRYYLVPMMDAWTNVFFSPGSRTTGNQAQTYAIVGPSWKGTLPADVKRVDAPTNLVWIVGRTATTGSKDYEAAHAFQDQMTITPLSSWGKDYRAPRVAVATGIDTRTPPMAQVGNMSAEQFFTRLAELVKKNPPTAADGDELRRFASMGFIPGKSFDPNLLSDDGRRALEVGVKQARAEIVSLAMNPVGKEVHGWIYPRGLGSYGTDYKLRAAVAMRGLGANIDADAIYPTTGVDMNGNLLTGKNKYKIHFTRQDLPPVNGFWSLTAYTSKHTLVKNPIKRFAIGDRSNLIYNKDGSLDIYVQNKSPGKSLQSNWLPVPNKDNFSLAMRLYWPKESALNGTWTMPGVQRVSPAPRVGRTASLD